MQTYKQQKNNQAMRHSLGDIYAWRTKEIARKERSDRKKGKNTFTIEGDIINEKYLLKKSA